MKRTLIALVAVFAVITAPALADVGVAYDQVTTATTSRPLPFVTDFASAWTNELALLKAHPGVRQVDGIPIGGAYSYAWLGTRERIENPLTGDVTIYRPDDRQVINIDTVNHTYKIAPGIADTYAVTTVGKPLASPNPAAPSVQAKLHVVSDAFPDRIIDGVTYKGFAGRITQTVDAPGCTYTQELLSFVVFADPNRRDPMAGGDYYDTALSKAPVFLSQISGCNVTSPDNVYSALGIFPGFLLYLSNIELSSNRDLSLVELPPSALAITMLRGNVRTLTDADAALFEPPAGYTKK